MKNILLIVFSLVLFSCATTKNSGAGSIYKMWNVISVQGVDESLVKEAKTFIDLSDKVKRGARAGCNHIFFTVETDRENHINFSGMGSTKMYCEKFMDLENKFLRQLEGVRSYQLTGENINFLDANGNVLLSATTGISWETNK